MQSINNEKLWFSLSGDDIFLIPESTFIQEGNIELINYFGNKRYVDANQVELYKVTRDTAKGFIKAQIQSFFGTISDSVAQNLRELDLIKFSEKLTDIIAPVFTSTSPMGEAKPENDADNGTIV